MERRKMFLDGIGTWPDILFVDPGVGGTGYAKWNLIEKNGKKKPEPPVMSGVLRATTSSSGEKAVDELCAKFYGLLEVAEPKHVVIEQPEVFSGSGKSHASAVKGDLFLLSYLIGGYGEIVRQVVGNSPVLVHPKDWKAQLPKKIVNARIKEHLNLKFSDHASDAVGMGLQLQGFLL